MANSVSSKVWSIDTDATLKTFNQKVKVLKMHWKPNAAADTLLVQDGNGNGTIWTATALAPGGSGGDEYWEAPNDRYYTNGFKVTFSTSAGSGTLYVHTA